jgi:thiol:disulfide interchange protein DsbC
MSIVRYCRKFHEGMGEVKAKGVAVRYLAFPRAGPETKAWRMMAAVWCAGDRREALDAGDKRGGGEGAGAESV